MAEYKETPDVPVTWDDLGQLASALSMITQANISEEVLAEISAVLIRRIGTFGEELLAEAGEMAEKRTEVVMVEGPGQTRVTVQAIQEEIARQAAAGDAEPAFAEQMKWAQKALKDAVGHLGSLEWGASAGEKLTVHGMGVRVRAIQEELRELAKREGL